MMGLLAVSAAAIWQGVRLRKFAFVVYGIIYGYAGISARAIDHIWNETGVLAYFAVTGVAVVAALVVLARRVGRSE